MHDKRSDTVFHSGLYFNRQHLHSASGAFRTHHLDNNRKKSCVSYARFRLHKKLGKSDFPTKFIFLWLSVWFAFLIFYTIVMIIFKIGSTSLVASFTGKFTGLITILFGLCGAYLFFKARSDKHPERMYTRWGKMAHKSVKLMRMPEMIQKASVTTGAKMVKGSTETFQTGKNMAEDTMKTFENLWKKEKR